jgi:hypothetical protein
MVFQLDTRHGTSSRSSAQQHNARMSDEWLVNCHRG